MMLVKEAIKARGLRISEVPPEMCKVIVGNTVADIDRVREMKGLTVDGNSVPDEEKANAKERIDAFYFKAMEVRRILDNFAATPGFCSPMSTAFRNDFLLQNDGSAKQKPIRNDLCLALALQTDASGKIVKPVAVCAWGEADFLEPDDMLEMSPSQREIVQPKDRYRVWFDNTLSSGTSYGDVNNLVLKHRVLSIDLVCAKGGDEGATSKSGSLLFMYALVKNLNKKSMNIRRYDAVWIEPASGKDPRAAKGKKKEAAPIQKLAADLGFVEVRNGSNVSLDNAADKHLILYKGITDLRQYVLSRVNPLKEEIKTQKDRRALPDMRLLGSLCATKPGSGIPYCT